MTNALIIYLGLLVLAALEAFMFTAPLLPGTLGVVAAGGFVQVGKLSPVATLLVVWLGVFIGDLASYLIARKFGAVLRRWKPISDALGRAELRLQRHPVAFILLSHLSPFLKNAAAPAAGLVGWSWRRFLPLEVVVSCLDAAWFLTLGFIASRTVGNVTEIPVAARIVGAFALLAIVGFFIGRGRKCAVPRTSQSAALKAKRGFGFLLKCMFLVAPWEFGGRLARRAGFYDRADYRGALLRAVEIAEAGDVILVGRTIDAPWGQYSHAMMVVWTPVGKALIHAYETGVQLTPVKAAPMCGKLAVVRVECTREQREAMVNAAWTQLATPFKLGSRKPNATSPSALNCIGLVAWAAAQAGLRLDEVPIGGVLVPDDILTAGNAHIIFEWEDGNAPDTSPPSIPVTSDSRSLVISPNDMAVAVSPVSSASSDAVPTPMIRSELFLGMSCNDGQSISDSEVSAFVDEEVVPRFPAGTTQVSANGTYGSRTAGIIHERSRVLTILHPNDPVSRAKIHDLAAIYSARFHQEIVLVVMNPAVVFQVAA